MDDRAILAAADLILRARGLLVCAGAGMGVDSGLPDFRGSEGFWKAYPPFRRLGLQFQELANPRWFREDPPLAWGFYGHRLALYRATVPHEGFALLRRWGERAPAGSFVFTSNVDGQFQKAGFAEDRIWEVHGSIHHAQCLRGCGTGLFAASPDLDLDLQTMRAQGPLPSCPACGGLARPNILMFGDGEWDEARSKEQSLRFSRWLEEGVGEGLVVVECGAGTGVPTVRATAESLADRRGARLVRINVREPQVPQGQVGIAAGALQALKAIDARMGRTP